MAKLTREQVKNYNSKMGNGFVFDIQHFVMRGEKQVQKTIETDTNKELRANIYYSESYKNFEKSIVIKLHISTWTIEGSISSCKEWGYFAEIETGLKRKDFKKLMELTHKFNDEYIMDTYTSYKADQLAQVKADINNRF